MGVVPFRDPQPNSNDEPSRWSFDDSEGDVAGKMSFLEHLDELRTRIMYSLLSLAVGAAIAFIFIQRLYDFVMRPMQQMLPAGGKLIFTEAPSANHSRSASSSAPISQVWPSVRLGEVLSELRLLSSGTE